MNSTRNNDTLPKLMTSQHKLLEPTFIKNTQLKLSQSESKILPIIQRSSMLQHTPKQLVVQRLINSLEFSSRHFGAACDRGFQGLSKYHYTQKFGHMGVRLEPLNRNIIADLTDAEDIECVPKDERTYYKKIYKFKTMPILALIKSFEIEWIRDFDDEVNKKSSKPLQLSFQTALAIFNTHQEPLEFFKKNLQLLERNTVALKQKGLSALKYKIKHFDPEEFQRMVTIKNSSGQGFFRIYYPAIQLYLQEYQHNQTIDLSPQKLFEIVKDNFFELESIVEQFDLDKFKLYMQEQLSDQTILQQLEEPKIQITEPNQEPQQQEQQHIQQPSYDSLGVVIIEEKHEFPEKTLSKRLLKKVVPINDIIYTVAFLPFQILIKEKRSQQIVKMYSPTLKELDSILALSTTKSMQQILDEHVETIFDMPPEAFHYKEFKKGTTIKLNIPACEPVFEVTEEQLNNGILQSWMKEVEINNKDIQIIIEPCIIEIYNQLKCSTIKRVCTSQELTNILSKRYAAGFRLV